MASWKPGQTTPIASPYATIGNRKARRAALTKWLKQQERNGILQQGWVSGYAAGEPNGRIMGKLIERNRITTAAFELTYEA